MERPSHIKSLNNYTHPNARRLPLIALAAFVQFAIIWGFTHGLGAQIQHFTKLIEVVKVQPDVTPATPQPPDPNVKPKTIDTVIPEFRMDGPDTKNTVTTNPPANPGGGTTAYIEPPAGPTRAPAGVTATHTTPPYPAMERRMGREGTVMLRLTVLADGHVAQAEVVKSSGHVGLDDAAKAWIIANWLYKPALDKGTPTTAVTLANVTFNLKAGQ